MKQGFFQRVARGAGGLLAAAVCFGLAGGFNSRLARARSRARGAAPDDLPEASPSLVFTTVVLGGFRGLVADLLWLRATDLQDRGHYVELVQLAEWITRLEPHAADIWAFHAWNMAYNVSVMMPDDADRWRWVRNGIRLLRDGGIRYNPSDPHVYAELAWIFLHKMGYPVDPAQPYYQRQWATEMTDLLGGPHLDYRRLEHEPEEKRRRLHEDYGLIPSIMQEIETRHGRLDWTRPETHALYWAHRGLLQAAGAETWKRILCERIVSQSLKRLSVPSTSSSSREES